MTLRVKIVAVAIVVLIVIGAGITYWLMTSTWFLWSLLPSRASASYVIGVEQVTLLKAISLFDDGLSGKHELVTRQADTIGIAYTDQGATLVIKPKLSGQLALPGLMRSQGWNVHRVGLVIRAEKGSVNTVSVKKSLMTALKQAFLSNLPVTPVGVVSVNADQEVLALIAVQYNGRLRLIADSSLSEISRNGGLGQISSDSNSSFDVVMPGSVLASLPADLHASWNDFLRDKLRLKFTSPDILKQLSSFKRVVMIANDRDVTVGVQGGIDDFTSIAGQWLGNEDRYSRPQKKVFRLPDGGIGYEQIPGQIKEVFGLKQDKCQPSTVGKVPFWLCGNNDWIVLSNTKQDLYSTGYFQLVDDQWRVSMRGDYAGLAKCQWCFFSKLILTGTGNRLVVDIWPASK